MAQGPSIKYITLFLANFDPLPLSHFVTHPGTPQSTSHISDPPIFSRPSTKKPGQTCTNSLSIVRGVFCPRVFCHGVFCLEGFVRGGFCPILPSVRIHLLQQKHHLKFHVSYV